MLKYNYGRMVSNGSFKEDELNISENIIESANLIYEEFAKGGQKKSEQDYRFLLGLGNVWGNILPKEFV